MIMLDDQELSNVLGWVSIACWIIVYSPQILENYQLKSGEGLSVAFVVVWLLGDIFNLVGAVLAGLLPTVINLAAYYTFCDLILLFQIYYYRRKKRSQPAPLLVSESEPQIRSVESTPLIDKAAQDNQVTRIRLVLQYGAGFVFITVIGVMAWYMNNGSSKGTAPDKSKTMQWVIQVIGWSSAVLYLGARIPQIFKNFTTRCEGLSPALFVFAITGNLTYAWSICAASMERDYLITNGSWLAGSALTVFLDFFVVCQFLYYRSADRKQTRSSVEQAS